MLNLLKLLIERICPDCQIVATTDAMSALAVLQNPPNGQAFDLLLTDYKMPLMDGLELARTAKRILTEIKIVLLS